MLPAEPARLIVDKSARPRRRKWRIESAWPGLAWPADLTLGGKETKRLEAAHKHSRLGAWRVGRNRLNRAEAGCESRELPATGSWRLSSWRASQQANADSSLRFKRLPLFVGARTRTNAIGTELAGWPVRR